MRIFTKVYDSNSYQVVYWKGLLPKLYSLSVFKASPTSMVSSKRQKKTKIKIFIHEHQRQISMWQKNVYK